MLPSMADAEDKTTKVVITGGGGFLGQVLAREILKRGRRLRSGSVASARVVEIVLADIIEPEEYLFDDLESSALAGGVALRFEVGDVSDVDYCRSIIGVQTRGGGGGEDHDRRGLSVFHLGAVMSGAPPDLALRVNLQGTINMLEATREWQEARPLPLARPTFMFSSAGATLGAGRG